MSILFDTAMEHVFRLEGGYVNDPRDPGGETLFGISRRAHPPESSLVAAEFWALVDACKAAGLNPEDEPRLRPLAARIYRDCYWDALECAALPAAVALFAFDAAIQHGTGTDDGDAPAMLQRAIDAVVGGIAVDGLIGPQTVAAAKRARAADLLTEFCAQRLRHYMLLDALDDTYGLGWGRRCVRAYNLAVAFLPG